MKSRGEISEQCRKFALCGNSFQNLKQSLVLLGKGVAAFLHRYVDHGALKPENNKKIRLQLSMILARVPQVTGTSTPKIHRLFLCGQQSEQVAGFLLHPACAPDPLGTVHPSATSESGGGSGDAVNSILEREPPRIARYSREAPEALEWIG
jgi:hypothetical protein